MKMTNKEILNASNGLVSNFSADKHLPVKVSFAILKNMSLLKGLAEEVDSARISLLNQYGSLNEETGMYEIPKDSQNECFGKINELFDLEQEVNVRTVSIDDFGYSDLSTSEVDALMFMISEGS